MLQNLHVLYNKYNHEATATRIKNNLLFQWKFKRNWYMSFKAKTWNQQFLFSSFFLH